jgi:hypothetical protein
MAGSYDVIQFFADGSHETVCEQVTALEAMKAARHYCTSIGAKLGMVEWVMILDDPDCCAFEWLYGQGVTFPRPQRGARR